MRILALLCAAFIFLPHPQLTAQSEIPRWRLVRDATAGGGEGPGALTEVGEVTVGRDGRVYVSQRQDGVVRVYDARGRYLREIGRSGEGPGEFEWQSGMGWRGDTLWVADGAQARISLFRPDGRFVRSLTFVRAGPLTGGRPNVPGDLLADGSVLGSWRAYLSVLAAGPVSEPLVRFTPRGEPIGVLARVERRNEFVQLRSGNSRTYFAQPFADSPMWAVAPDGSALVVVTRDAATSGGQARFTVRKVHFSGRTAFARAYRYVPKPLPSAAVERVVDEHVGGLSNARFRTPPEGAARRSIRRALYLPKHLTPVTGLVLGRDGTIWLRREEDGRPTVGWIVLDPAGNVVARLSLPAKLDVRYADRTQLWGVELDEMDVPTLARFRVAPVR
ncbi:MAG TPA: 6-bladed beta-propeller [Longimicrobiaceae bacterium]